MSSSQFETFVKNNKLESKLRQIAVIAIKNAHEKDIAKLVFTVFNEFKLQLPNDLQKQMESMFGMVIKKTIKVSHQNKLKADDIRSYRRRSYWRELEIRNENNRQLGTIENVFKKALETKIEKEKYKEISTTRRIEKMPDVFLIKYERLNNTSPPNKLKENVKCKLAVQFNNIPYNLKGVILHEGDSIENGNNFGKFSKIYLLYINKNFSSCLFVCAQRS